ncbi:SOS response-associated peptidase [Paenibacillus sp. 481]|uniref:SOS response-associated peptidase n=1 Tax=Paenibacillus sp. 481 TaxID=2835869 RepID=UPI001E424A1A|nr:SOS response-associated peptidase [Paenibacillus sp. 481]UHA74022.1 SOS response-associated peptidase [Paenibacillus sp. 481]
MCGRFTLTVSLEELMAYYEIEEVGSATHTPRYNIAPSQSVTAVIHDGTKLRLGPLRWGLVPSWAQDDKLAWRTINARSETLRDKPAFRTPFQRKRCLIPTDGFYEWKQEADGSKQPMRIVLQERKLFSMAGLYDTWINDKGEKVSTCTIITTTPNSTMEPIHDRMPVILSQAEERQWLDRRVTDTEQLQALLKPCPSTWLNAYPVDRQVGNVRVDSPACIEPIHG